MTVEPHPQIVTLSIGPMRDELWDDFARAHVDTLSRALGVHVSMLLGGSLGQTREASLHTFKESLRPHMERVEAELELTFLKYVKRTRYRSHCRHWAPLMLRLLRPVKAKQTAHNRKHERARANRASRSKKR